MSQSISRIVRRFFCCLGLVVVSGCSTVHYYGQLVKGHLAIIRAREPIDHVINDSQRDPRLRQQLTLALDARRFASAALYLPDNRSYRLYSDIDRPYVVWNVFATPELSLSPILHCFPVAGCVAYRGYYREADALAAAERQRAAGQDVYVAGVQAYSTLGWFADPILSSMLQWDEDRLAGVIFHELAHQKLYIRDDTVFNESFASFVEQQGLAQWRALQNRSDDDATARRRQRQFVALIMASRQRLQDLYAGPLSDQAKREAKAAEFERLREEYDALVAQHWQGVSLYAQWMDTPFNNAKLLPFGLYDQWVPAFAALFRQVGGNWPAFYARARRLGELSNDQRQARLQAMAKDWKEDERFSEPADESP